MPHITSFRWVWVKTVQMGSDVLINTSQSPPPDGLVTCVEGHLHACKAICTSCASLQAPMPWSGLRHPHPHGTHLIVIRSWAPVCRQARGCCLVVLWWM